VLHDVGDEVGVFLFNVGETEADFDRIMENEGGVVGDMLPEVLAVTIREPVPKGRLVNE